MITLDRAAPCISTGGHALKAWMDSEAKPPRPIGLTCTNCGSWWPIAVSHYVIFIIEAWRGHNVGHTIDGRHLDRTRCGIPMTPGTWTTTEHPRHGCTACLPTPNRDDTETGTAGDGENQLGLWQDVQ
ncbi:hypothetical protein [Streptosporangium sp. NPDC051022]|uniref:hypothetical protein n=1 Tax=Streptosporangium sp. NPDC051022 TaxID=3155752 RepID=UPI0034398C30